MSILDTIEQQRQEAETEVARLKALCEELKGALEVCADVFHAEGWRHLEESARSALKKAQKP